MAKHIVEILSYLDNSIVLVFSRPYLLSRYAVASFCLSVCRLSVCNVCIVAKRCVLEQTLLLTAYRKLEKHHFGPLYCDWVYLCRTRGTCTYSRMSFTRSKVGEKSSTIILNSQIANNVPYMSAAVSFLKN